MGDDDSNSGPGPWPGQSQSTPPPVQRPNDALATMGGTPLQLIATADLADLGRFDHGIFCGISIRGPTEAFHVERFRGAEQMCAGLAARIGFVCNLSLAQRMAMVHRPPQSPNDEQAGGA